MKKRDPIKEMLSPAITSDRDDVKATAQATKAHWDATVEQQFKSIGYLLVAHGGGLVSCVTFVKEKSSIPGVQIFTSFFAYGFLAAMIAYGFTLVLAQQARLQFIFKQKKSSFHFIINVSYVFMGISGGLLMLAVILVARNFGAF